MSLRRQSREEMIFKTKWRGGDKLNIETLNPWKKWFRISFLTTCGFLLCFFLFGLELLGELFGLGILGELFVGQKNWYVTLTLVVVILVLLGFSLLFYTQSIKYQEKITDNGKITLHIKWLIPKMDEEGKFHLLWLTFMIVSGGSGEIPKIAVYWIDEVRKIFPMWTGRGKWEFINEKEKRSIIRKKFVDYYPSYFHCCYSVLNIWFLSWYYFGRGWCDCRQIG